ncbi:MAG: hypothetical protein ABL949_03620 [Fimbriimonadaceae bacterium]
MVTKLARAFALLAIVVGVMGCASDPGPNDPTMSAEAESKSRANQMTPDQVKARESRPR